MVGKAGNSEKSDHVQRGQRRGDDDCALKDKLTALGSITWQCRRIPKSFLIKEVLNAQGAQCQTVHRLTAPGTVVSLRRTIVAAEVFVCAQRAALSA
jgi:hypothetical protein